MTDFNFKEGDKVYCPSVSNKVLTLMESDAKGVYAISLVCDDGTKEVFTADGKRYSTDPNPSIFPATQEWYDKLVQIYPDLEKPPVKKDSKEIIGLMKEAGHKFILCKAKDHNSDQWETVVAFGISSYCSPTSSSDYMHDSFGTSYFEFYPINSKGQKIIDYVDGEIVLED